MPNNEAKQANTSESEATTIKVKPHTYQPSKAELETDLHIDATPEELRQALVRPVVMEQEE